MAAVANLGLRERWARLATLLSAGAVAGAALLFGLADLLIAVFEPRSAGQAGAGGSAGLAACGAVAVLLLWPQARVSLSRAIPIDPSSPVHLLALVLTLTLFGLQVQSAFSGALTQAASSAPPLDRLDLVLGEIPFLLVAVVGVGLFIRRDPRATAERLGYRRPAWWHIAVALIAAGAFFGLAIGFDLLGQYLTPGIAKEVNSANSRIFGSLTADPAGVITLAIAAGVCEEALFRGALQPRLGILWTSLLFASVHTQYGISFDALAVLVLAIGLGLLRRFLSTTASTVCHVTYDCLVGFGLGGVALAWTGVVEGLLTVLVLGALVRHLSVRPAPLPPS